MLCYQWLYMHTDQSDSDLV